MTTRWYDTRLFRYTLGGIIVWFGLIGWLFGCEVHAQTVPYGPQGGFVTLAPGTYALRSLCPPVGAIDINVFASDGNTILAQDGPFCVNGRIGVTFTVSVLQRIGITLGLDRAFGDPRLHVDRDCLDGPATTCTLRRVGDVGTATGKFTYPGDIDWVLLPDDLRFDNIRIITVKEGCFASGKVFSATGPDGLGHEYLATLGGPASCAYLVTAQPRPGVE